MFLSKTCWFLTNFILIFVRAVTVCSGSSCRVEFSSLLPASTLLCWAWLCSSVFAFAILRSVLCFIRPCFVFSSSLLISFSCCIRFSLISLSCYPPFCSLLYQLCFVFFFFSFPSLSLFPFVVFGFIWSLLHLFLRSHILISLSLSHTCLLCYILSHTFALIWSSLLYSLSSSLLIYRIQFCFLLFCILLPSALFCSVLLCCFLFFFHYDLFCSALFSLFYPNQAVIFC